MKELIILIYKHLKDNENTILLQNRNIKMNFFQNLQLRLQKKYGVNLYPIYIIEDLKPNISSR